MKKENVVTAEAIRADLYGFTYKEYAAALGEEEAKRSFVALYGRKRDKNLATLSVRTVYRGTDTDKYLFELPDGKLIETVCIKRRDGATVCVSTQVGCPVGCVFCESGRNGFVRNLTPSEIVQQVILIPRRVTRIVFMGMGEPLFNYDNVIQAIHILRDRNGLDFPTDGITISTTGPLDRLKRLREEHLKNTTHPVASRYNASGAGPHHPRSQELSDRRCCRRDAFLFGAAQPQDRHCISAPAGDQ